MQRFKGKLVKIIKDVNGAFDYYSVSSKFRQNFLHCSCELVENYL